MCGLELCVPEDLLRRCRMVEFQVRCHTHRLAFESVETEAMDFASTTLNGIVWKPDDETKVKLALTNTTSAPLDVTTTGNEKVQSMTLKARETRVIELEQYLGDSHASLVTLNHDGPLGALIATGFALNERTGFSANLNFVDCATAKTTRLAAAHVRFGQADPQEGFPAGTNFIASLVIANTMDMQTEAQISVTYTVHSASKTIKLRPITLGAREVRLIELSKQMAHNGVAGPIKDAGVDISYTHMPGTVIGRLTSYDASGDYAFDVPVKDPVGHGNGGYPWRLDNGFTTVVQLKNTLNKEASALVQVRYADGSYHPDRIKIGPYQTVAIDIRKLRDAQNKDIRGGVMPKEVESGQFAWFEEEFGSVIGRAEVADISRGVASSFSCEGGCPCSTPVFNSCAMNPPSGSAQVGESGYMFAPQVMKRDCNYVQYGPYSPSGSINWSSDNTSVVTVDSGGNETTVGLGSAGIVARFQEIAGYMFTCGQPVYANLTTGAHCDVLPPPPFAVPVNMVQDGNGTDIGQGYLHFDYSWESSTGSVADLANCTMGESISYPGVGPYAWTSPPYAPYTDQNPFIVDFPAYTGASSDTHYNHGFLRPYFLNQFTATQKYRYRCPCANGGDYVDMRVGIGIQRDVNSISGVWSYSVTKSGASAQLNLP